MSRRQQRPPKTPEIADIVNFSHDGRGIARINGKTTFIQNALVGETVVFQYTRTKSNFDEGVALEIVSPSSNRVPPRCAHYSACGGCSLQHLDEKAQIHEKQSLLLDLLRRIGKVEPESLLPPLSAGIWHYRNKARLSVRYVEKKQGTLVGFREKNNPRYIAEIEHCPVLNARVDEHIMPLRALIDSFDSPQSIAQVEVAAGDDEVALIFRNMAALSEADQDKLRRFGEASSFKLYLQPQGVDSVTLFYSPHDRDEYLHYQLPDEQVRFRFHPTDFTQVNAGLNRLMVSKALELMAVDAEDVVLDLFCGLGNFSLPLARRCREVIGVEGSETMVKRAAMNAEYNGISNARFYSADLDQVGALASIVKNPIHNMLIDPPRSGALEIVRQIDKLNPIRLVYVSCNPATLARDTDILVNHHGYHLRAVGVMDMFPHTAHVESIALFEKDKR